DAGPALLRTLAADLPLPPDVQERALNHLRQHLGKKWSAVQHSGLLDKAIDQLLKTETGKAAGVALIGAAAKYERLADVQQISLNAKEPPATRLAAVQALGNIRDAAASGTLTGIVKDDKQPLPLRVEAVSLLGREISSVTL